MSESEPPAGLPPLNIADLLDWEELLTSKVLEMHSSGDLDSLNSVVRSLLEEITEGLRGWLAAKTESPFWIETFLWIEDLESIRPVIFWRTYRGLQPETREDTYRKWLYNEFFAIYYADWFREYIGLSQLQYRHGVSSDFEFHFVPTTDQNLEFSESKRSCSLIVRLDTLASPELEASCSLLKKKFRETYESLDDVSERSVYQRLVSLCSLLDQHVDAFVAAWRNREELFAEGSWASFVSGLGDIQARLENDEEKKDLRDSVTAGIFLLYLLFVFDRGDQEQTESIFFLRSSPNVPRDALQASLILAGSSPQSPAHIEGYRAAGRMMQHVLSEVVLTKYRLEEARNAAVRAAAAGIMARNMSHNLGSHVIPRSKVAQIRKRLDELYPKELLYDMMEDLKGHLDDYIQQKADFLAEISSEPLGGMKTGLLFRDVLLPFMETTTLIDNLAANEGFGYTGWNECSLRLRCFVHTDGERREIALRYDTPDGQPGSHAVVPYGLAMITDATRPYLDVARIENEEWDVEVGLPGPVGEYALYGILENLIRNAAKHNPGAWYSRRQNRGFALEINIELRDDVPPDPDHWCLEIWDNVTDASLRSSDGTLLRKIQTLLAMQLVTKENNAIRSVAWGLAEVMICANQLAGRGGLKYDSNVLWVKSQLEADKSDNEHRAARLVYGIRLPKVKKALLIGRSYHQRNTYLRNQGIVVGCSLEELFIDRPGSSKAENSSVQFAILDETPLNGDKPAPLEAFRYRLPFRVIRFGARPQGPSAERGDLFLSEDPIGPLILEEGDAADSIMVALWTQWLLGKNFSDETLAADSNQALARIDLYLDLELRLEADKVQTRRWTQAARRFNLQAGPAFCIAIWAKERGIPVCLTGNEQVAARRHIVFDRHGQLIPKIGSLRADDAYILFDKASPDFTPIFHSQFHKAADRPWLLPYQMLEAGLLRILVIDERIAERSLRNVGVESAQASDARKVSERLVGQAGVEPLYWHVAQAAGVTVATHIFLPQGDSGQGAQQTGDVWLDSALHPTSFLERQEAQRNAVPEADGWQPSCPCAVIDFREEPHAWVLCDAVEPQHACRAGQGTTFDLAVVHQGILDRLPQQLSASTFMKRLQENVAPWVVVESGRGVPPGVRMTKEKFLPFSVLDRSLNGLRVAKLTLCQRLMSLTRRST